MDLLDQLHRGNTRANRDRIARWAGTNPRRFAQIMEVYLKGDERDAQLAAGVLFSSFEFHPGLLTSWLPHVVRRMDEQDVHPAVRRFGVWALQRAELPRTLQGRIADCCFRYLSDPSEPIAIRAFSMNVLARIVKVEPELAHELEEAIRLMLPHGTVALRRHGQRVLRKIGAKNDSPLGTG